MRKIIKCCNKIMEIKGITQNASNGWGTSEYAVIIQCNICGKFMIFSERNDDANCVEDVE